MELKTLSLLKSKCVGCVLLVLLMATGTDAQVQSTDLDFDASLESPALLEQNPRGLFDEAHLNFHTSEGTYRAFVDLITNDGCVVTANQDAFTGERLNDFDMIVISNARALGHHSPQASAFSDSECEAVVDWVSAGGSLLLIADDPPYAAPSRALASRFGIHMSRGWTYDVNYCESASRRSWIRYSSSNGHIGDHAILRGRGHDEAIQSVLTFTGQSLRGPRESVPLLLLSETAVDRTMAGDIPAQDRCQGLALEYGDGRIVVLGEAAMISAQVIQWPRRRQRFGMSFPGVDNRQFTLNLVRWLARLASPER